MRTRPATRGAVPARAAVAATALVAATVLAGCATAGVTPAATGTRLPRVTGTTAPGRSTPAEAGSTTATSPSSGSSRATPTGSTPPSGSSSEPAPPPGVVLPDRVRTPGALNPAVTQADIGATICVSGWTDTVRPSSSYTTALKQQQLASGYAIHGDMSTADYEEDHLVSLELGGSPTAPSNLWPEPYDVPGGARAKDRIEDTLHALVCARTITLATAQQAIANDWWAAYLRWIGPLPAPSSTTSARG